MIKVLTLDEIKMEVPILNSFKEKKLTTIDLENVFNQIENYSNYEFISLINENTANPKFILREK